jgi:hypothetical protein
VTTLLIEPFGGMAGDMLLAALCDLGDPRFGLSDLEALTAELVPGEATLALDEVRRGALRGLELRVRTTEMEHAPHRHLSDLLGLLARVSFSDAARDRAANVLRRIARAESKVHGIPESEVHFHEVGAVDTLIDVCGAALALERLGVTQVFATPPLVGDGTVTCAHGEMPVPAPGTAELLRGIPVRHGGGGERLTPTGAALLAEFALVSHAPPVGDLAVGAIGYGAGARDPRTGPPNLVRVQLGESAGRGSAGEGAEVLEFAFHVDDSTGEEIGFCLDELRALGVLDAWHAPVFMKKGRPGVLVSGLVRPGLRADVERVVFAHTSTFGVRWSSWDRTECARDVLTVELDGHAVRVKRRRRPGSGGTVSAADLAPEYEDLAALARHSGTPLRELAHRAIELAIELVLASASDR